MNTNQDGASETEKLAELLHRKLCSDTPLHCSWRYPDSKIRFYYLNKALRLIEQTGYSATELIGVIKYL